MPENGGIDRAGLAAAVEQAADGVVVTDSGGKILYVNPAFTVMTGYSGEDAVGKYPSILKSGHQPAAFYEELWKTILSGRTWRGELVNRRKDGTSYTEEMRITPVAGADGGIVSYIAIKHDVTEERAAEEARGFLAAIVESSADAIVTYTPASVIRTWNHAAETILGHSAADAIGMPYSMLVVPERRAYFQHFTEQILQGHAIPTYETVCLHKQGRRIPVSVTGSPVRNPAGEVVAVSVILRDISERHDAERKLQESEKRFRGVFEHAPFGMCVTTMDGSFLQVNIEFCRMLGYSEKEMLAADWPALTYPADRDVSEQMAHRLVTGRSACEEKEKRYIHRSGNIVWARTRIALMRDSAGCPSHFVVHVEDIAERRRAEEALRKSEELFRLFMDNSPALAWMKDEQGRYVYLNETYQKRFGLRPGEQYGKTDFEIFPPAIAAQFTKNDQAALSAGRSIELSEDGPCPDGDRSDWMSWKFPFQDASGRVFVAGIGLEVTEHKRAEEAMRRSETKFRTLYDSASDAVLLWGENGFFDCNKATLAIFGCSAREEFWSLHPSDLSPPVQPCGTDSMALTKRDIATAFEKGSNHFEWLHRRTDTGTIFPAEVLLTAMELDGKPVLQAVIRDITARKQAEQILQHSEEKFRQLAENIREVFWIMDNGATEMLYVSPAYEQIWGKECAGLYADPDSWMHSIHPEDRAAAEEIFLRQVRGEILENEYRIVQPSGAIRWIRDRAFPVRDRGGNIIRLAGVAEDATERKLSELHLVHQAYYDELTDLPNRRLFREKLGQATADCEDGKTGAVFFVDIDEFKLVNDTLGHATGDKLLIDVARRLLAACGNAGTLARFGGDEFTLLAAGFEGPEPVRRLGEKLIECLDTPFRIADREVFVSASVGISLFPAHGTDPLVLKTDANVAMHEAKRAGKNQIRFFTPALADAARERLDLETKLRRAVALAEFKLQFQPQFAAGRPRPTRFEALVRWCPPDRQPIPPSKFIPLAEQIGLIVPLGTWILREACRRCADWQTGNLRGVGVAVNVSALQFVCPDFVEMVARTLKSTGLRPQLLELELTESIFIRDMTTSARTLKKLRSLGVTIALDDFGTGYSSLSYLQNLQIDALKMDREFLVEAVGGKQGAAVMRCVVEMAHALGLRVIAEGVETTGQMEFLAKLGCDEIQGFLPGRPSFDIDGPAGTGKWTPVYRGAASQLAQLNAALIVGRQPSPEPDLPYSKTFTNDARKAPA